MDESNAWRFECCNRLANALAQDERAVLAISVVPIRRRGLVGKVVTAEAYKDGRVLAACRHEVDSARSMVYLDWLYRLAQLALPF